MKLALLQPQFAPNLYDLASMLKADLVIWNDLERWSRKGRTHRAAIKGEHGLQWINIPIRTEDKKKTIGEVRIDHTEDWIEPFWNALLHNYSNATWFDFFAEELEADIRNFHKFEKLIDLNTWFFYQLKTYMEFDVIYHLASQTPEFDSNPDVFSSNLKADILYQEYDAKNYQWLSDLQVQALQKHPVYRQGDDDFIAGLSILDLLFYYGKESFRIIDSL
ncbi:MAG TPA: WbqC family protein [Gracilimonas sp.]|nr:WbqC family protein [Gracilimonas sp.]